MDGILYLESGQVYRGKGFGAAVTKVGELVFTTSMSGYQELLTDPAVKGQVINMTYPLIGNCGISEIDSQSDHIHVSGLVTRDISFRPSGRFSVMSLSEWLKKHDVPGVYNVDTREIMKKIRSEDVMKCVISTERISKEYAMDLLKNTCLRKDCMKDAGVEMRVTRPGSAAEGAPGKGLKIVAIDFGIKRGLLAALTGCGMNMVLCPYTTTADEILSMNPDGLLLPCGPGEPGECGHAVKTVQALVLEGKMPVFGIGLGHLVLAQAMGGSIYKMKPGHYGGNHGVKDLDTGNSVITSQHHGFAVDPDSLKGSGMVVSHINLNDGTVEGIRHRKLPAFSVQFGPEGTPGPMDSAGLIKRYADMVLAVKSGTWKGSSQDA